MTCATLWHMKRNDTFLELKQSYLFPEILKRKKEFLLQNPDVSLISLGIGDTTLKIPHSIADALSKASLKLGTDAGYVGYGPEKGIGDLRERVASRIYGSSIHADEIFISDGAKCDIGRLQMLFGHDVSIAVQDPAYPVYVDGSLIQGVKTIVSLPCTPENNFFPDLKTTPRTDLIYFCSPNNPTGAVATKAQLKALVDFAKKNHSIIIFDAAYANFIQDPDLPKSIYEIEGAKEVAIEIGSFSKLAGFTGIRLGWTIVPDALKYEDGSSVKSDWNRLTTTLFNGASYIAQIGGAAALEDKGWEEIKQMTHYYMENAKILSHGLKSKGFEVFGGENAPYLWVRFKGKKSWDVFQELMAEAHVITTPGAGFGPAGEGFIRFTAFGSRENIQKALIRIQAEFQVVKN